MPMSHDTHIHIYITAQRERQGLRSICNACTEQCPASSGTHSKNSITGCTVQYTAY